MSQLKPPCGASPNVACAEMLRENGTPVWYLRAENEGHGFARKENADYEFYATVMCLRAALLAEKP